MWNYKYADVEFGRLQARDLLQHLWTGPISNAPVDIVQGSRSVEARPVSISKGMSMKRVMEIMCEIEEVPSLDFEYVLCMGHFLQRDENLYTYFEGKNLGPLPKEHQPQHHHNSRPPSFAAAPPQLSNAPPSQEALMATSPEGAKEPPRVPRKVPSGTPRKSPVEELHGRKSKSADLPSPAKGVTFTKETMTSKEIESTRTTVPTTFHSHNSIDLCGLKLDNVKNDLLNSKLCSHGSCDFKSKLEDLAADLRSQEASANGGGDEHAEKTPPPGSGKLPIPPLKFSAFASFEELPSKGESESEASRLRAELGLNQPRRSPRVRTTMALSSLPCSPSTAYVPCSPYTTPVPRTHAVKP